MPKLINDDSNVLLQIELISNEYLDFEKGRSDNMNWIPFEFLLNVNGEKIQYSSDVLTALSVREIKYLLTKLKNIINLKTQHYKFEDFGYITDDCLFELKLYDTYENNLIYLEIWLNMASLTNGKIYGFSKGFRFIVTLDSLVDFAVELEKQFNWFIPVE